MMAWYQWFAWSALGICLLACLFQLIRLIRLGKPVDYARPAGKTTPAVAYAFTGAMSPGKKESAYLHLPTYTAGLLYHTGTFLAFFFFFLIAFNWIPKGWPAWLLIAYLSLTTAAGTGILVKRMLKKELGSLSNPDDYISNILVTLFQLLTLIYLFTHIFIQSYRPTVLPSYHLTVTIAYHLSFALLMLYVPVGKLRHMVYFFAARYHLGMFFGWRGVWPPRPVKQRTP